MNAIKEKYLPLSESEKDKFWSHVLRGRGCWSWTSTKNQRSGRPVFDRAGRKCYAHRLAFVEMFGEIDGDLDLDHLCRNVACVRPSHLEPVTHRVNTLRGHSDPALNARKKMCRRGHSFDSVTSQGRRRCRQCWNAYMRQYRERAA